MPASWARQGLQTFLQQYILNGEGDPLVVAGWLLVDRLSLSGGQALEPSRFSILDQLTGLKVLSLAGLTAFDNACAAYLAGLAGLEELDLSNTGVTDDGLSALAGLTSLRKVSLTGCAVDGSGLAHVQGLPALKELDLTGTQVRNLAVECQVPNPQ